MVVAWRNGAAVRLPDVAEVIDGVEDTRTLGLFNGEPAVIVLVTQPARRQHHRDRRRRCARCCRSCRPQLPHDVELHVASDRTNSIRASLREVEVTLIDRGGPGGAGGERCSCAARARRSCRRWRPSSSLLGTFGVMYLLGFSLNNLSLMALTVATGFVVDDAIVVLENTTRHIEAGMDRMEAALLGAREVGFTVLSISLSLVAVFIPLLFMGGQVGRLFREFAVTLSAAVLISLVISLTTTPMMCAWLLEPRRAGAKASAAGLARARGRARLRLRAARATRTSLDWALASKALVMLILRRGDRRSTSTCSSPCPRASSRSRTPASSTAACAPTRASRPRRCGDKLRQVVDIIRARPGGRHGGRLHRRLARRRRLHVRQPEAGVRSAPSSGQAVIARLRPQLAQRHRPARCSSTRCRTCARAGARATRPTSTRSRATTSPTCGPGRASSPTR